jgi:coenzyme F420-reducing hydrogenase beta subunit
MNKLGFLVTGNQDECFGCEACVQACPHAALSMMEDCEGFRYPNLDRQKCVDCNICHKVCPVEGLPNKNKGTHYTFGGYCKNQEVREQSTSGGAFSAIVDSWCKKNYVIFGAISEGLNVRHAYVFDKGLISNFRKSKYSQSVIGDSYKRVKTFLKEGKNVVFSGTPCQNAGLIKYLLLSNTDLSNLLTIEVVCEGVPSPLYVRKLDDYMAVKYGERISSLDYRYKCRGKWDFECMKIGLKDKGKWDFQMSSFFLKNGRKIKIDRWFNPFWSIWLNHLISRPSCYKCPFATADRISDITLGDLWGVHIYCPELYGHNGGSSLIVANTIKGKQAVQEAQDYLYGHELDFQQALKYQSPMRMSIAYNQDRDNCMADLMDSNFTYNQINKKWAKRPDLKLLFSKYMYGNKHKVAIWNLKQKIRRLL